MSEDNKQVGAGEKPRVFISHSSRDESAAKWVAEACRELGADTWLGFENLKPGENWKQSLREAIDNCDLVIVVLSNLGQEDSDWTQREWSSICEQHWDRPEVRVVPIRLDDTEPPAFLRNFNSPLCRNKIEFREKLSTFSDWSDALQQLEGYSGDKEEVRARFEKILRMVDRTAESKPMTLGVEGLDETD